MFPFPILSAFNPCPHTSQYDVVGLYESQLLCVSAIRTRIASVFPRHFRKGHIGIMLLDDFTSFRPFVPAFESQLLFYFTVFPNINAEYFSHFLNTDSSAVSFEIL